MAPNTKVLSYFILLLLFFTKNIHCQTNKTPADSIKSDTSSNVLEMDLMELMNQKVVSATREINTIKNTPVTTKIIRRKEILSNHYSSITDILKDIPGIKVSQPGNGINGELFLNRGLIGNYYTKFLIDGIPVKPSITNGISIDEHINIKNAQRIEIVESGASSLYGADALGGVINIITFNQDENYSRLDLTSGSDYYSGNYFSNKPINHNILLSLYATFKEERDMNFTSAHKNIFSGTNINGKPIQKGNLRSNSYSSGIKLKRKNLTLSYDFMYYSNHSSIGQDPKIYKFNEPTLTWGEYINRATIKHIFSKNDFIFQTNLMYLRYRQDNRSAFGMYQYDHKLYKYQASDDIFAEEKITYQLTDHLQLLSGISFKYSGGMPKTNDLNRPFDQDFYKPFSKKIPQEGIYQDSILGNFGFNPILYHNFGSFFQVGYEDEKINTMFGVRYDSHSEYGDDLNFRIAGLYHITSNTTIRYAYNEGFKAPEGYRIYNSVANTRTDSSGDKVVDYLGVPNKDLKPENSYSYEIGVRQLINKNFHANLQAYRNKIDGLITNTGRFSLEKEKYPNAANDYAGGYINDKNAESVLYGFQLDCKYKKIIQTVNLDLRYSFTYFTGHEILPGNKEINNYRMVPDYMSKLVIKTKPLNNLMLKLDVYTFGDWYSRQINSKTKDKTSELYKCSLHNPDNKIEGYTSADMVVNYSTSLKNGAIIFYIKGLNLFDKAYGGITAYASSASRYNPQFGRRVRLGMDLNF